MSNIEPLGKEEDSLKSQLRDLSASLINKSKREAILRILETNSRLDRSELMAKTGALQADLARYMSAEAALLLLSTILHREPEGLDILLKEVSPSARKIIIELNALYRPFFEGIFGYPNDWYRATFAARYDFSLNIPFLYLSLIKKSGEVISLESSFDDMILLVNYLLGQVEIAKPRLTKLGVDFSKSERLKEMKRHADSLMSATK